MTSNEQKNLVLAFEKQNKIKFKNKELLLTALTHSSYAHEHNTSSYERLEFLGDSVLGLVVSERLYNDVGMAKEGKLSQMRSRIVSEEPLAELSEQKGYYKFLRLGAGESTPPKSVVADGVEAIIGAIYLDGGFKAAKKFVLGNFNKLIEFAENVKDSIDSKSLLQERFVKVGVKYVTTEKGACHEPTFVSKVFVGGKLAGSGEGKTKRAAEKEAASVALESYKIGNELKTRKVKKSEIQKNRNTRV